MQLTSPTIGAIAAALAKAQGEMENAPLNRKNPHFNRKYADLAAIRDAIVPALSKNDIAVIQAMDTDENGRNYVITSLIHKSGEWLNSKTPILADKASAQAFGSALTYAKRQAMSAIAGISADDDDDANGAESGKPSAAKPPATVTKNPPAANADPEVAECRRVQSLLTAAKTFAAVDEAMADTFVTYLEEASKNPANTLQAERLDKLKAYALKRVEIINDTPMAA